MATDGGIRVPGSRGRARGGKHRATGGEGMATGGAARVGSRGRITGGKSRATGGEGRATGGEGRAATRVGQRGGAGEQHRAAEDCQTGDYCLCPLVLRLLSLNIHMLINQFIALSCIYMA